MLFWAAVPRVTTILNIAGQLGWWAKSMCARICAYKVLKINFKMSFVFSSGLVGVFRLFPVLVQWCLMFNAGERISLKIGSAAVRNVKRSYVSLLAAGRRKLTCLPWPLCWWPHTFCATRPLWCPRYSKYFNFNIYLIHFNTCDRRDHPLKPTVPLFLHQLILLGRMDLSPAPDWLRTLSSVMSYLDCSLNPLIYCSHQDFREAGLALLWTRRKLLSSDPVLTAITPLDMWHIPSHIPRSIPISSTVSFFGQLTDAKPKLPNIINLYFIPAWK